MVNKSYPNEETSSNLRTFSIKSNRNNLGRIEAVGRFTNIFDRPGMILKL